ncbi:hypothetical protein AAH995_26035 [Pseudomonas putida]|uniref:Uncharacterized protein n=1 Tax=Pseudomonas putida TaxID=303 RepID=A0A7Y8D3C5_PSEPU|nr:hypothetical protein [Pseudomonas putida]NWC82534.1 hypothetical protein [Pseudomonas putida]
MSDWMGLEITLGLGSIVLGILAGRVSAWVACWLPAILEQQWQRDARELLGLDLDGALQASNDRISGAWNLGRANRLRCLVVRGDGALWANHSGILCPAVHLVSSGFELDRQ